jgi:hypothetical protein
MPQVINRPNTIVLVPFAYRIGPGAPNEVTATFPRDRSIVLAIAGRVPDVLDELREKVGSQEKEGVDIVFVTLLGVSPLSSINRPVLRLDQYRYSVGPPSSPIVSRPC